MKIATEVNAKKETYQLEKAKELLRSASRLFSAKGKKLVEIDLKKQELDDAEISKLMLGPTGNLRAPTLVKGKNLIVGFDLETYQRLLG